LKIQLKLTFDIVLKVLINPRAEINFNVKLEDTFVKLAYYKSISHFLSQKFIASLQGKWDSENLGKMNQDK
jgi:hypothetical protein